MRGNRGTSRLSPGFSVWSERKRVEKLRYMHSNPVKGNEDQSMAESRVEEPPSRLAVADIISLQSHPCKKRKSGPPARRGHVLG